MIEERAIQELRQNRAAILVAFPSVNHQQPSLKIDILDAQTLALKQAQSAT